MTQNNNILDQTRDELSRKSYIEYSSWSHTKNEETLRIEHIWSIDKFDEKMLMKNGDELSSGHFIIDNFKNKRTNWFLKLFPNGSSKSDVGFVSLWLYKTSSIGYISKPLKAVGCFYLLDREGAQRKVGGFNCSEGNPCAGFNKFINHASIVLSDNRSFTVVCKLHVSGDCIVSRGMSFDKPAKLNSTSTVAEKQLSIDMRGLLDTEDFSDCNLVCGERKFRCHKIILSGRSSVFRAMFTTDMEEKVTGEVVIDDIDEDTLYRMLMYIYCGKVVALEFIAAALLLPAADKYDLQELKQICEISICENIDMTNVLDMLILSNLHNSSSVQSVALKFFRDNGEKLVAQKEWKTKLESHPAIMSKIIETMVNVINK